MKRQTGFSLLEVMVALAVLGLVLGSAVRAVGTFASNHEHLRDRSLARWVASNVLVEGQLGLSANGAEDGSGRERMGGRVWKWVRRFEPTGNEKFQRAIVEVYLPEDENSLAARVEGLRLAKVGQ